MTPLLALKIAFLASVAVTALFAVLDSRRHASWRMVVSAGIADVALAAIWLTSVVDPTAANAVSTLPIVALAVASNALVCSIAEKRGLRSPVWISGTTLVAVGLFVGACDANEYLGGNLDLFSVTCGGGCALTVVTAGFDLLSGERARGFIRAHRNDVGCGLLALAIIVFTAGLATTVLAKDPSFAPLSLPDLLGERTSTALLVTVLVCAGVALCAEHEKASWLAPAVLAPVILAVVGMPLGYTIAVLAASACTIAMSGKGDRVGRAGLTAVAAIGMVVAAVASPLSPIDTPLAFSEATSWVAETTGPTLSVLADAAPVGWRPSGLSLASSNEVDAYWPSTLIAYACGTIGLFVVAALALATPWRSGASSPALHRACPASLPLAAALGMLAVANVGSNLGLFPETIGRMPLLSTGLWTTLAGLAAVAVMACSPIPVEEATARAYARAAGDAAGELPSGTSPEAPASNASEEREVAPSPSGEHGRERGLAAGIASFACLCVLSAALVAGAKLWATAETQRIDTGELLFRTSTMESPDDLAGCRLAEYATGDFERSVSLADAVGGNGMGGELLRVEDTYEQVVVERTYRIAPGHPHARQLYRAAISLESAVVLPGPESSIPDFVDDSELDKTLDDELARLAENEYSDVELNSTDANVRRRMLAVLKADDRVVKRDGGLDSLRSVLMCDGRYAMSSKKLNEEFGLYFDFILDGKELHVSTIRVDEVH